MQQRELQRDGVRKVSDRVDVREADEDLRGKEEQPLPVQASQALPLHERGLDSIPSLCLIEIAKPD